MISVDWFWPGFLLNNRLCDEILSWCWISFSKKVKVKLKKRAEGILCYFWRFFKNFCFWPMKRLFLDICDFRAFPLTALCPLYHHQGVCPVRTILAPFVYTELLARAFPHLHTLNITYYSISTRDLFDWSNPNMPLTHLTRIISGDYM